MQKIFSFELVVVFFAERKLYSPYNKMLGSTLGILDKKHGNKSLLPNY